MVFKNVVIFCCGKGAGFSLLNKKVLKSLVKIDDKPIIWYILKLKEKLNDK